MHGICFSCAGCGMIKKHDFLHKAGAVLFLVAQAGQLFGDTEAAALPALLESGRLPARISGLPASARALLAASMHAQLDAPVLAVCPDEAAAELFQKDLSALLGQDVPLLTARLYVLYGRERLAPDGAKAPERALRARCRYGAGCGVHGFRSAAARHAEGKTAAGGL